MTVTQTAPLPLNFPQDFLPERRLLADLLAFAAENGTGNKLEIGAATGIPTGKSTGKVEPMIHYALGMGLIEVSKRQGSWQLCLTALGRVVRAENPYLSESVTLWLLHLMLCRRHGLEEPARGIADAWFACFADGDVRLGRCFDQAVYLDYLTERHGHKGYLKRLSGLVPRAYLEAKCLGPIAALSEDRSAAPPRYARHPAPNTRSHYPAYAAYLFILWDALYPGREQLALAELFAASRCLHLLGWDDARAAPWLDWMTDRGLLQCDRQTGGILALRLRDTETVICGVYDELI